MTKEGDIKRFLLQYSQATLKDECKGKDPKEICMYLAAVEVCTERSLNAFKKYLNKRKVEPE